MTKRIEHRNSSERGVALISALLAMTMMLGIGIALVYSTTVNTSSTRNLRVGQQAFYAADTGLAIGRRAIVQALAEEVTKIQNQTATYGDSSSHFYSSGTIQADGSFPTGVQVITDPDDGPGYNFYTAVYARAQQLVAAVPLVTDSTMGTTAQGSVNNPKYTVVFRPFSGSVDCTPVGPSDPSKAGVAIKLRYSIQVTGSTDAGGSTAVNETGRISVNLDLKNTAAPGSPRNFAFSGFGAFFDNGDTNANSFLASGTFSGPVHTNTHFSFSSSRNVIFRNIVSQADNFIRYDSNSFGNTDPIPLVDRVGIDFNNTASEGYKKTGLVPLPVNTFSQEYAVINGTGIIDLKNVGGIMVPVDPPATVVDSSGNPITVLDATGHVTAAALAVNLRNAQGNVPSVSSGKLNGGSDGVYISSGNGTSITGGGIYIQGDAQDIQLYAGAGTSQVYRIKQASSKITTITVNPTLNTTTIADSTGNSATYIGVPMDKSNPAAPQPGVSLFVNGEVTSLRGGFDSTTGKNTSALASGTRLTVSAVNDITITGDLTYANPVVDSQGLPVTGSSGFTNVLGLFTNNGNVNLNPNSNYNSDSALSLVVNAAIVSFNSNTSDDGGTIQGSITYTGGSSPSSSDKWTLVGSRVQSNINNIGYANRNLFFDPRFSGGGFRPPFFPGTTYTLGVNATPGVLSITSVSTARPLGISWYREVQ